MQLGSSGKIRQRFCHMVVALCLMTTPVYTVPGDLTQATTPSTEAHVIRFCVINLANDVSKPRLRLRQRRQPM